ncbi:MAG: hypothetical protein H6635_04970 [Anaerolineales bacterium]|nr:hypothetical protein [Anaerolineales bacterium]MCB9144701.1 hypothetical protein [Anaerolineales bacterium]
METNTNTSLLSFNSRKVLIFFGVLWLAILCLSLAGQYLRMFPEHYGSLSATGQDVVGDFIQEFDVNSEANVTSYYSVSLAILSSLLFFVVAYLKYADKDKYRLQWVMLGFLLLYISMDDASVIHEKFSRYLKGMTDMGGWFEYKWVIIGLLAVVVIGVAFFRFWLHLDTRFKILFLLAGGMFFGGAVGFELIGGRWAYSFGSKNFFYSVLTTFEQGFQYAGLTTMIYSLLFYLKSYAPQFNVSIINIGKKA